MKRNIAYTLPALGFIVAATVLAGIPSSSAGYLFDAQAQTSSLYSNQGPAPPTWRFDRNGHLTSVPGRLNAFYDNSGRLQSVQIYEEGRARKTTFTAVSGKSTEFIDVRIVYSENKNGVETIIRDYSFAADRRTFELKTYCVQVLEDRQLVSISFEQALQADPSTVLAGVEVKFANSGQSTPFFVGGAYGHRISLL